MNGVKERKEEEAFRVQRREVTAWVSLLSTTWSQHHVHHCSPGSEHSSCGLHCACCPSTQHQHRLRRFPADPRPLQFMNCGGLTVHTKILSLQKNNDLIPENRDWILSCHHSSACMKSVYLQFEFYYNVQFKKLLFELLTWRVSLKSLSEFWLRIKDRIPNNFWNGLKHLPFCTTRLCKVMFSALMVIKSKHQLTEKYWRYSTHSSIKYSAKT